MGLLNSACKIAGAALGTLVSPGAGTAAGVALGGVVGNAIDGDKNTEKKETKKTTQTTQPTQISGLQSLVNDDNFKLAMTILNQNGCGNNITKIIEDSSLDTSITSAVTDLASKLFVS